MGLLIRFIVSTLMGFVYVYFFTHLLAPIKLILKGKRLHHNLMGSLEAVFVVFPLVFFLYILNYDLLNIEVGIKLAVSFAGLVSGTVIEHKVVHGKHTKK